MPQKTLSAAEFVDFHLREKFTVIDTRSESEFAHASFPGAVNIPLLTDDHRKQVGTLYKQKGREAAVLKGFELSGPRFHEMIRKALESAPSKKIMLYCWRGGMRSHTLSWILELNGFEVYLLKGGYKAFRNWVLQEFQVPRKVLVLGGATGSGKTEILNELALKGEQVIDLEGLANHKGSAFGGIGKGKQPFNEMFENNLAIAWHQLDNNNHVWLENESKSIGSCMLPHNIYELIRNSELIEVEVGVENRKKRITRDYGCFPVEVLAETTIKISKRMGPQHAKEAISLLQSGNFDGWLEIILDYYDKLYNYGNSQRDIDKIHHVDVSTLDPNECSAVLINLGNQIMNNIKVNL